MDVENKYNTLSVQKYCLSMLYDFDLYCKKYNIYYSLACGTLLGAVRHKGFIPWDDDVDIMFTRQNYNKFMHCFKEHPMDGYTLIGKLWIKKLTKKDNPLLVTEGQCIDLFVLDIVPKRRLLHSCKVLFLKMIQGMLKEGFYYQKYSFKFKILSFCTYAMGRLFDKESKQKIYNKLMHWEGDCGGDNISIYNAIYKYMGMIFPKSIVSDYIELDFENMQFMAISGYDVFLRICYGDYMVPPPERDRKPQHIK